MSKEVTAWILPIEPFEERYTEQWLRWYPEGLQKAGLKTRLIMGNKAAATERAGGQFLDPIQTWIWKGSQVEKMAELWRDGEIKDGDWIVSLDGWGPATTAAAYLRDTNDIDVRVAAFFHAGSYDQNDYLAHQGMRRWAMDVERGWIKSLDLLLLGSRSHQDMIQKELGIEDHEMPEVSIIGNPIKQAEAHEIGKPIPWNDRDRLVVFPHRLAEEKQPHLFEQLRHRHRLLFPDAPETTWVKTRDICSSKTEYYELLGKSRVVLSFALQETFGIAMQEGIVLGAWAVAPKSLSYPETIGEGAGSLFQSMDQAAGLVEKFLSFNHGPYWDGYHEDAAVRAGQAILNCQK
jgi:glycosyltransferase involved in cell wall biosynthesis